MPTCADNDRTPVSRAPNRTCESPSLPQNVQQTATQLLAAMGGGDAQAAEQIFPLIHQELRTIADRYIRPGHGAG